MRAVRHLPDGLALLAGVLGCSRTINYTAGVCDCNPPDVTSVLVAPPRGYSMIATSHAAIAPVPAPQPGPVPAGVPGPSITILPPINAGTQGNNVLPGNVTPPVNNRPGNKLPPLPVVSPGQRFPEDAPKLVPVPAIPVLDDGLKTNNPK